MILLPPEVGESLGLGRLFQVTPFNYETHRLDLTTTEGPERMHLVIFSDTGGRRGYAFRSDTFPAFASAMVEANSGLLIPQTNQRNGKHD